MLRGPKDNELRFTAHMPANLTRGIAGGRAWSQLPHGDRIPAGKRRHIPVSCSAPPGSGRAQMAKVMPKLLSAVRIGAAIGAFAALTIAAMAESATTAASPDNPKADAGTEPPPPTKPETKPSPNQQPSAAPAKSRSWNFKSQPKAGAAAPSAMSAEPPPPPPSGGDEKHPGGVEHAPAASSGHE